jgi:hypothetical protein
MFVCRSTSEMFGQPICVSKVSLSTLTIAVSDVIYLAVAPTALATIGWKFLLVFVCLTSIGAVVIIFIIVETKGLPLEEVSAKLGNGDGIMVRLGDIHVDRHTHTLIIDAHNSKQVERITLSAGMPVNGNGDDETGRINEKAGSRDSGTEEQFVESA